MHLPDEDDYPVSELRPYPNNARTHSPRQIRQIADSIKRFGFTNPVIISEDRMIIAGHGRVEAAKLIGLKHVPVRRLSHLSQDEIRAYILADNKLAENAGWDEDLLRIELGGLIDLEVEVEGLGFSTVELDLILDGETNTEPDPVLDAQEPVNGNQAITQLGDLWQLGPHRLLCGDARSAADVDRLLGDDLAALLFTDPPYNVPINGNVGGLGKVKHREFAVGSGELDRAGFIQFLKASLGAAAEHLLDGAIAFVCMDWRHMSELIEAGDVVFDELKNLCVWNKTNGGMGFYRSKHELVFVYKKGKAAHINNFGLGDTGRYRTNVWDYPGISSLGPNRDAELSMHPTVKPVTLIADAIKDCSRRGQTVLDVFGGSGSTLIAADQCGRRARLIEIDPIYCDTIISRFERITGDPVHLIETGESFASIRNRRLQSRDDAAVSAGLES